MPHLVEVQVTQRKHAERLEQLAGPLGEGEHDGGLKRALVARRGDERVAAEHQEARHVAGIVLDVRIQRFQAV